MAEITLDDVTLELMQSNEELVRIGSNTNMMVEYIDMQTDYLREGFANLLNWFQGNSLADLEAKREQDDFNAKMLDALKALDKPETPAKDETMPEFKLAGWALGLAGMFAAFRGAWMGQMDILKGFFKGISKSLTKLLLMISPAAWQEKFGKWKADFKGFTERLQKNVKGFKDDFIKGFKESVKFDFFKDMKANLKESWKNSKLKAGFDKVGKWFDDVKAMFKVLTAEGGIFTSIKSMLKGLTGPKGFGAISLALGFLFKPLKGILRSIGRVFYPLVWIMGIFDAVNAMFEESEKENSNWATILGAGLDALFKSIVLAPLDLLKDIVSWSLEKLGFENASKWLDSWTFESLYEDIKVFFKKIPDRISQFFDDFAKWWDENMNLNALYTKAYTMMPGAVQAILPTPEGYQEPEASAEMQSGTGAPNAEAISPQQSTGAAAENVGRVTTEMMEQLSPANRDALMNAQDEYGEAVTETYEPIVITIPGNANPPQQAPSPGSNTMVVPMEASPYSRGPNWDDMSTMP